LGSRPGTVEKYKEIQIAELLPLLAQTPTEEPPWRVLQAGDDLAYRAALEDAVLDPEMLQKNAPKMVFTPIHGTGAISAIPALKHKVVFYFSYFSSCPYIHKT
jgi:hypothetical protein